MEMQHKNAVTINLNKLLTNANKHKFLVCSKAKQRVVVVGSQWRGPETALSIKKVELRRSGDARRDMVTKPEKNSRNVGHFISIFYISLQFSFKY